MSTLVQRLSGADLQTLQRPQGGRMNAYPAYGMDCPDPAAFACRHADGNLSTQLVVTGSDVKGNVTTIHLKDPVYNLFVDLKYRTYSDVDMIEAWTEITNKEKGTVTLTSFASAMLPIRRGNVWISHISGAWGNEANVTDEPLSAGELTLRNHNGVHNAQGQHAEVMFSLDGKGKENSGDVIGSRPLLQWLLQGSRRSPTTIEYHYFFAGIDEQNSEYHLRRGETFVTPPVAFTFSKEGKSGVSRNYHHWKRKYMLAHGNKERMILLNRQEGVYMDINEKGMDKMMGDIAGMGGEALRHGRRMVR